MKPSLILKVEKQMYNTTQYVNITNYYSTKTITIRV